MLPPDPHLRCSSSIPCSLPCAAITQLATRNTIPYSTRPSQASLHGTPFRIPQLTEYLIPRHAIGRSDAFGCPHSRRSSLDQLITRGSVCDNNSRYFQIRTAIERPYVHTMGRFVPCSIVAGYAVTEPNGARTPALPGDDSVPRTSGGGFSQKVRGRSNTS